MYIGKLLTAGLFSLLLSVFVNNAVISTYQPSQPDSPSKATAAPTSHISRNWAGYVSDQGTYTGVSGTWIVPQVNDDIPGADATWVGIGGVDTHDLIQTGTQATVEENGDVTYEAFWETLPSISQPFPIDIHSGDTISASVNKNSNGKWHITLNNITNGQKADVTVDYDSSLSSAEWIEEAPSGMHRTLPLDNFGTVSFQKASAIQDNKQVNLQASGATSLMMGDMYGQTLAIASDVGSDGASFSISRAAAEAQDSQQDPFSFYTLHIKHLFGRGFFFHH